MTELQKDEFQILEQVIHVCEQLDITYFLVCGSALGAAKYQGFIPWDDDVDIGLPREDYKIFCREAPHLLDNRYFVQNVDSEPQFPMIYSKVRDRNTTFIESTVSQIQMNHGVYVDVFPLDGYPQQELQQKELEQKKNRYKLMLLCCFKMGKNVKLRTKLFIKIMKCLKVDRKSQAYILKINELISSYSIDDAHIWCNHGNWQGKLEYAPREQYGNGTWAMFEGLKVRIPERYDEYLTQKYGDWRSELPVEQQVGHHHTEVIDLTRPYTDYVENLPNGHIRIKRKEALG